MRLRVSLLALVWLTVSVAPSRADAERGAELLRQKQCTACHSVLGSGGGRAPDLGRRREGAWDPAELASLLWNHGPRMWEEAALADVGVPELSANDVADLYDYLASLWRYDPIGVASYGQRVWTEQQCFRCHPIVGSEQGVGPPVLSWEAIPDAVEWVRQMWNHAGIMAEEFDRDQGVWPVMTVQELVDLAAYVENMDRFANVEPIVREADERRGEELFASASCNRCHTIGGGEPGRMDLAEAAREKTLAALAVEMWNHAPLMSTSPFFERVDPPRLEKGEMAAVLGYVTREARRDLGGDAERGARVFEVKGCAACHNSAGEAPPLDRGENPVSVRAFTAGAWRHGPAMAREMTSQGIGWPSLTANDVADLLAYLNR